MELFENPIFKVPESFSWFSDIDGKTPRECFRKDALARADEALKYEMPVNPASLYLEFFENGNRTHFEKISKERRMALMNLFIGCFYDKKEEYIRKMIDLVWTICEESSWVYPAHSVSVDGVYHGKCLPDTYDNHVEVDLVAGTTGALLSFVLYYYGKDMDAVTDGVISERIKYEVKRRIIKPFLEREVRCASTFINNWASWISSNVLICAAVVEDEMTKKRALYARCMEYCDRLVKTYGNDAGCNEGAEYWGHSVGTLFDAAETMYDLSCGTINVLESDFLRKACLFIADMNVSPDKNLFFNFADCPTGISPDGETIARMGRRYGDERMKSIGNAMIYRTQDGLVAPTDYSHIYRSLRRLFDETPESAAKIEKKSAFYPDLGIAVLRSSCFSAALKGGHNNESHNHNDVGNIILYHGDTPVFIDTGNQEYEKNTFGSMRYTIWVNRSLFHNLPEIGGCEQVKGEEHRASSIFSDGKTASVEYSRAYPDEAGASECMRKVTVSDSSVIIDDSVECTGSCKFNFMTKYKPVFTGNEAEIADVHVIFDGADSISVEEIPLSSPMLKNTWKTEFMYKISVCSKHLKTTVGGNK